MMPVCDKDTWGASMRGGWVFERILSGTTLIDWYGIGIDTRIMRVIQRGKSGMGDGWETTMAKYDNRIRNGKS